METSDQDSKGTETGGRIKTFRDLIVRQKSMSFLTEVHGITESVPQVEQLGLISQVRRCGAPIPGNVAESYGRKSKGDYIRFLQSGLVNKLGSK